MVYFSIRNFGNLKLLLIYYQLALKCQRNSFISSFSKLNFTDTLVGPIILRKVYRTF